MLPRPYVDYLYVNENNTEVMVVFNESMKLSSGWNETDFNLYVSGYQEPYNITWSLRNAENLTTAGSKFFVFDINVKDQMAGHFHERIHVQFLNDEFLRAETTTLKLLNWTVSAHAKQHASQLDDQ